MTEFSDPTPSGGQTVDVEAMARDNQLLDQVGAGMSPTSHEPLFHALHAWRVELSTGIDDSPSPQSADQPKTRPVHTASQGVARVPTARGIASVEVIRAASDTRRTSGPVNGSRANGARPTAVPSMLDEAEHRAAGTSDSPRRGRRRAAVAAGVVGLTAGLGGVAVAAADAQPGSTLWPVTQTLFRETAEDRQAAEDARAALANARRALDQGRFQEAERFVEEAERKAGTIEDDTADKLQDEADDVRSKIDKDGSGSDAGDESPGSDDSKAPGGGSPEAPLPTPSLPTPSPDEEDGDKEKKGAAGDKPSGDTRKSPDGDSGDRSEETGISSATVPGTLTAWLSF